MATLDEIRAFYSEPSSGKGGKSMLEFLNLVDDILQAKRAYFDLDFGLIVCKSLARPWGQQFPFVSVSSDGTTFRLKYSEIWQDGPIQRVREEQILCELAHSRAAFVEMIARLKLSNVAPMKLSEG
jgi:hypothetical protein